MNRQIYEEASEWLVELRVGDLDGADRERLDAWLRASPENVRAFLELSSLWEEVAAKEIGRTYTAEGLIARAKATTNVVSLSTVPPKSDATPLVLAMSATGIPGSESTAVRVSPNIGEMRSATPAWRVRRSFLVAASLATVAIGAGGLAFYSALNPTYATGVGQQRSVQLPDGSTVDLNAQSRIRVRFTVRERDVDLLAGQALFKVAKNPARPFVVKSDMARVRAVGTQFDVNRKDTGTTVTVLEGRVAVVPVAAAAAGGSSSQPLSQSSEQKLASGSSADVGTPVVSDTLPHGGSSPSATPPFEKNGSVATESAAAADGTPQLSLASPNIGSAEVFVSAGEQVVATPSQVTKPARADVAAATAWTKRELVFDSTPLADVVAEFNRFNAKPLIVSDASLKDFHVTGVFSSTNPSSLLEFLRAQKGIQVQETPQAIRISKP